MSSGKPKSISELLAGTRTRLGALQQAAQSAASTLDQVLAQLPADLGKEVHGASVDAGGQLTLLVTSGAYAERIRYALPTLLASLASHEPCPTRARVQVRPRPLSRQLPQPPDS